MTFDGLRWYVRGYEGVVDMCHFPNNPREPLGSWQHRCAARMLQIMLGNLRHRKA